MKKNKIKTRLCNTKFAPPETPSPCSLFAFSLPFWKVFVTKQDSFVDAMPFGDNKRVDCENYKTDKPLTFSNISKIQNNEAEERLNPSSIVRPYFDPFDCPNSTEGLKLEPGPESGKAEGTSREG